MTRDELAENYPDLLVMDPEYLDEAIIGVVLRPNMQALFLSLLFFAQVRLYFRSQTLQ